jgi:membrane protease YdiL (CAAX protease family)
LPWWQSNAVLIGMPLLYWLNTLMPWSYGLFVERDHRFFFPMMLSICVLHWATLVLALWFLNRGGGKPAQIGLDLRWQTMVPMVAALFATGAMLVAVRYTWPRDHESPNDWRVAYPFTLAERSFFIFVSFSAGFCEEIVYRGFAITMLKRRGWGTWPAIGLATLSFIFMHGLAAIFVFPLLLVAGILYGALFLWRKDLTLCIYLHTLFDQLSILAT